MTLGGWEATDSPLARCLVDSNSRSLQSYESMPEWIEEHAHIEQSIAEGGYGHRQVYELVQNGADAMVHRSGGRIEVILTDTHLYCANEGDPIDQSGLGALLGSNMSRKRGDEIGRFGLGFKSVLAVTDKPEFFSRPVSLRFSDSYSGRLIRERVEAARNIRLPILRLGEPLDPRAEAQSDPVLEELLAWSVTTVRLERDGARDTSWLAKDLAEFPTEFLLFTRHVNQLILDNRVTGVKRTITVQRGGEEVRLLEGERDQAWRVFRKVVEPTAEARRDAGARAERNRLPVDWAVPMSGAKTIGKFWAFFPTTFETTLSGILNAPWKTNPDRENLLVGDFNEFLIDVAAGVVIENLQRVSSVEDPGKHLDRMPARGDEARSWADRRITKRVYELAANRESLPDQRGQLEFPIDLRIHPERVSKEALELWCSFEFRPHRWVHRSVETRERRPRVERLLEASRDGAEGRASAVATFREWLEALAEPATLEASAAALAVAELLKKQISPMDFDDVRSARIVLSKSGQLVAPDPNRLFIGGRPDVEDTYEVDPRLLEDGFAERALRETFSVVEVDRSAEFAAYVAGPTDAPNYWTGLWERAAQTPVERAKEVLGRHFLPGEIHVRAADGEFSRLSRVLVAGRVVDAGEADAEFTLDESWHRHSMDLLRALGATDLPLADRNGFEAPPDWYDGYVDYARAQWRSTGVALRNNAGIEPDHNVIPSHLDILPFLSPDAGSRMTSELLRMGSAQDLWTWRQTGSGQASSAALASPAAWWVARHGTLQTTRGLKSTSNSVSADLLEYGRVLAVSRLSAEATMILDLPRRIADCPVKILHDALKLLADETDDVLVGRFVAAVAMLIPTPEKVACRIGLGHGTRAPNEITVIANPEVFSQLRTIESPTLLVPTEKDADNLVERWGMRRAGERITIEIGYQPSSPAVPLIDEFPGLRLLAAMAPHLQLSLQRCTELTRTVRATEGQTTANLARALNDNQLFWLVADVGDPHASDTDLLSYTSEQLNLKLSDQQIVALLQGRKDESLRKLIARIHAQPDDVARLIECFGAETLRRYIPAALMDAVAEQGHEPNDRMVAEMARAVHGVDILREAKSDLERLGHQPPIQWAGGRIAQEFVRNLGFPREYAGFPEDRIEQVYDVLGPVELKKLHPFQETVRDRFRTLLGKAGKNKRAMLSLPTGAGKTRVAVQSLVEHFAEGLIDGPVLWIAQGDELCEQAVQAWAEVWRAKGPPKPLTISRLWDVNSAEPTPGEAQVVIATVQKLNLSVVDKPQYDWLANAAVVIVDEAHRGATTAKTTQLLRWLGLGTSGTDRCPLIGLTATPFIGHNEVSTEILVRRYGRERLDLGLFPENDTEELISLLQDQNILSRVEHRSLDGIDIDLNEAEMESLNTFKRLPKTVEARLGLDAARNTTIVNSIKNLDSDWQVLVFAPSVENAQTLAALLRLADIPAATVTAETRSGARRHYIQQFKDRKIRVLTNYGTLTTGFDAPEVRAVYVTRPTYSPNLYLQMIGRGLRGPANGGTDECLIVDVDDNVQMYGGKLAFTDFEFLWNEKTGA